MDEDAGTAGTVDALRTRTGLDGRDLGGFVANSFGGQPVPNDRFHAAILGQESGGNPNERTSVTGAVGIGQIEPGTFKQFANPGEDINNPADNYNVSRRITDHYLNAYNGDHQRAAVAYFSGPGNVAPPGSPTPWITDRHDPNGKYVSSYVNDINRRLSMPEVANASPGAAGTQRPTWMPTAQTQPQDQAAATAISQGGQLAQQQQPMQPAPALAPMAGAGTSPYSPAAMRIRAAIQSLGGPGGGPPIGSALPHIPSVQERVIAMLQRQRGIPPQQQGRG